MNCKDFDINPNGEYSLPLTSADRAFRPQPVRSNPSVKRCRNCRRQGERRAVLHEVSVAGRSQVRRECTTALDAPAESNLRFGGDFLCSRNRIVLAYIYLWPFRPTNHPDLDSEIALDQFRVLFSRSGCSLSYCFSCIRCGRCTNAFRRRSRSIIQPTSFPFVRFKGISPPGRPLETQTESVQSCPSLPSRPTEAQETLLPVSSVGRVPVRPRQLFDLHFDHDYFCKLPLQCAGCPTRCSEQ